MNTIQNEEPQLKDSLDRLVLPLRVPQHLPAAAMVQGRRLRARRRKTMLVSVIATAAVVGLGVPSLLDARSDEPSGSARIASSSGDPTTELGPVDWWDMTARRMEGKLMPLLPTDSSAANVMYRNVDRAPGEELSAMRGYLAMDLDTGNGYGGFNMVFYEAGSFADPLTADALSPWSLRCPSGNQRCEVVNDADGNPRARLIETVADGVVVDAVNALRSDGVMIYAAASNSTRTKWIGPPTIDQPPLDLDKLLMIADNGDWGP
jgi:hypothetical protein